MSPSATPATQSGAAPRATKTRPSAPPEPAQCHKYHSCHAKWRWMSPSATLDTHMERQCHQMPRLPRKVARWQSCVWKMVCDKVGVWQSYLWKMVWWKMVCDKVVCERWCERWCVTKWCVKDGVCVWQSCVKDGVWKLVCDKDGVWKMDGVWQRWCVTKMVCDKDGVWKMVCERWCVTKWCDKDGVWKMVCDKVVCQRWCVTKWCVKDGCVIDGVWQSGVKDGVWQSCVWKMVCDKDGVWQRWCVTKWCVTKWCVKIGVWQSCMWKIVCERWCVREIVCVCEERLCAKDCVWKMVCEWADGRRRRRRRRSGVVQNQKQEPHTKMWRKKKHEETVGPLRRKITTASLKLVWLSTHLKNLRPRGTGWKLAWQGAWHENTEDADAAEFTAAGDMPTVSPGGLSHGQTACAASRGGGVVKYEVSCDWRFQPPPKPC